MTEKGKDIFVGCITGIACFVIGILSGVFSDKKIADVEKQVLQERIDTLEQWHMDATVTLNDYSDALTAKDTQVQEQEKEITTLKKALSLYKKWNNELCVTLRAITGDSRLANQYEAAVGQYEQTIPVDYD